MYYQINKLTSRIRTTQPSLTDQSQRNSTDLNVMLKGATFGNLEYGKGAAPAPVTQDFTNLPADYRDMIEFSRQLETYRGQLPSQLRDIPPSTLINMPPNELLAILKPPATPPEKKDDQEEKK